MTNKDTTPTSGAADLPEALPAIQRFEVVDCIDSKHVPAVIPNPHGPWVRYEDHIASIAAGQATAAQAVVQDDLITIRKPTTSAELLWLLKLAHLVISDVDKALEAAFAPAQPAAQQPHRSGCTAGTDEECVQRGCGTNCPAVSPRQGVAYAALPEPYCNAHDDADACYPDMFSEQQMRAFADATHALRASRGQAPAGAGEAAEHYRNAIARARLLDSDLSNLTERGAKAWAGVDAQGLRDGGASPSANAGEPLVRYCPGCGSVGPVDGKYRDCCPDGGRARMIPEPLANQCRDTFQIAVRELLAAPPTAQAEGWTKLPGQLPEPGNPVLLDIGKKYPIRALWAAKNTVRVVTDVDDWGEYDEETDEYYCPEGWYEWNEHEEVHWAVSETPRAWSELPQPLPAAPGPADGESNV